MSATEPTIVWTDGRCAGCDRPPYERRDGRTYLYSYSGSAPVCAPRCAEKARKGREARVQQTSLPVAGARTEAAGPTQHPPRLSDYRAPVVPPKPGNRCDLTGLPLAHSDGRCGRLVFVDGRPQLRRWDGSPLTAEQLDQTRVQREELSAARVLAGGLP